MTLQLFFTVMWCFLKPMLFIVTPAMLIGERLLRINTKKKRRTAA